MEVTLYDILNARETRVLRQQSLLTEHRVPLLCFTMNIAGPVKTTPLIERGFRAGLEILDSRLPQDKICFREIRILPTGCEANYAISISASELKLLCSKIEDTHPLGRLFDMDVIDIDGAKLQRKTQRSCIVCGAPGRGCAASRAHSVEELQVITSQLLTQYFRNRDQEIIASCAINSLIDEVHTTPKPGLVDRRNNGSHNDMDLRLFEISARSLQSYFKMCVQIGQETACLTPEETFSSLRQAGLEAEKTMYQATGGVNTHKGAIYTMGILCGSIGRLWRADAPIADIDRILAECGKVAQASVKADFAAADGSTAGQRLYLKYGLGGIRAEVAAGLPSVKGIALPCYQTALDNGLSKNDAGVLALLHLITHVDDTNLHHRGGSEGAHWAARTVETFLHDHPNPTLEQLEALDDAFIARNLSPGGCADLLAVTYFLQSLNP